ncbi:MAG: hypothetical protein ACRD4M_01410 [Candidatus Acidiferrales bacterium]
MNGDSDTNPQEKKSKEQPRESRESIQNSQEQSPPQESPTDKGNQNPKTGAKPARRSIPLWQVMRCRFKILCERQILKKRIPREKAKRTDIATVILTLCIALAAIWSAWIFQSQLQTMQETLSLTDRSWLKVTDVIPRGNVGILSLGFHDINQMHPSMNLDYWAELNFKVRFQNIGHSPARNVEFFPELYIIPFRSEEYSDRLAAEEGRSCDAFARRKGRAQKGVTFPGDFGQVDVGAVHDVQSDDTTHIPNQPDVLVIALIGCIKYQSQASPKYRQTRFVYEILHLHARTRFFEIGKDVAASDLWLIRDEEGDYSD